MLFVTSKIQHYKIKLCYNNYKNSQFLGIILRYEAICYFMAYGGLF